MMAKRPTTPAPAVEAAPIVPEAAPALTYILNPISRMSISPRTRDEIEVRDVIRREILKLEEAVIDFVAAKEAEGWTLEDINEMYAIEMPLMFGYSTEHGRIRASYPIQRIERGG